VTVDVRAEHLPTTATGATLALALGEHSINSKPLKCYNLEGEEALAPAELFVAMPPWLVAGWDGVAGDHAFKVGASHMWRATSMDATELKERFFF